MRGGTRAITRVAGDGRVGTDHEGKGTDPVIDGDNARSSLVRDDLAIVHLHPLAPLLEPPSVDPRQGGQQP